MRGEGCGVLILKRLSDAIAANDRIHAVIRGVAVNHDGHSNGLSAPNGPAQEAVLRAALADARLDPRDIQYIEAHGTGTRLGDPIEIEALLNVLGEGRSAGSPLLIGSVKTNIGHLESAAGVAGISKVIMMLRNRQIPAHLHLKKINPLLAIENSPIQIPVQLQEWNHGDTVRRAGVSSFGFGGTNAHVILEEAPAKSPIVNSPERPRHILTLSARTPQALAELAGSYANDLQGEPGDALGDLAFTANSGRTHFAHRAAVVVESVESARDRLRALQNDPEQTSVVRGVVERNRSPKIAFLFTGQGAQYAGMGRTLYQTQPTFRRAIDECAAHLDGILDRPLASLLAAEAGTTLDRTGYTQPVMFAVEYALATLWRSWGIEPFAVLGHSVGEFAAACVAGVYELEDGLRLIVERARLMQGLPSGGMMAAVMATADRVTEMLRDAGNPVDIAAFNGPESIVISGTEPIVREMLSRFEAAGIKSKPLATSHAFHSLLMDPILAPLQAAAAKVKCHPPRIAVISNLTGRPADAKTYAAPDYWTRHARSPVRFHDGIQAIADLGCELFLEIGPNPILIGMGRRCVDRLGWKWLPSLRSGRDEWQSMLESLAELYVSGASVDWGAFDRDYGRRRTSLPTYPFQRRRYWPKSAEQGWQSTHSAAGLSGPPHPFIGHRVPVAVREQIFEGQLLPNRPALLADHKIQNVVVMPGSAFLEMALAASAAVHGKPWVIRDASLMEPLVPGAKSTTGARPTTIQTVLTPEGAKSASFRIATQIEDETNPNSFCTHAFGRLDAPSGGEPEPVDLAAFRAQFTGLPFSAEWHETALRKSGLQPGPTFKWYTQHWLNEQTFCGELRVPCLGDHLADYHFHPGLLDCSFQLLGAALPGAGSGIDAYVPMSVGCIQVHGSLETAAFQIGTLKSHDRDSARGDIFIVDRDGRILAEIIDLTLRRVPRDWIARLVAGPQPDWVYELAWIRPAASGDAEPTAPAPGRWLIFDERHGVGKQVALCLETQGQTCRVTSERNPDKRRALVREFVMADESAARGVIYLTGLNVDGQRSEPGPDFAAARADGWGGVLDVVHGLLDANTARPPQLWLVTRGAQSVGDAPQAVSVAQSSVWGLGRVIAAEHPELACTRIDLDLEPQGTEAEQLVAEVLHGGKEDQVALRGDDRYVTRLRPVRRRAAGGLPLPAGKPYRLEIIARGQLDQVALRPVERRAPEPGQVEIKVQATGLNFRDVLNVLDLYPGDPGPLGGECAGEVMAVGAGVEHVKPGDQVLALAPASFSNYAMTIGDFVVLRPDHVNPAEAATLPICFLTCWYALYDLGQLKKGERILIHAASGGVGLAAIQLARQVGAEIFATAGSDRKREYLKSLGIQHVMDSRSTDFAAHIIAATGGEGIDMVLNSLTGETIGASLSTMRLGGRLLELGKTDLWDQSKVDAFRPGIKFFAIALDHMMADEPHTIRRLFGDLMPQFTGKKLTPLPLRTYPIRKTVDALRHMARAEHIGKVIIEAAPIEPATDRLAFREDGTYLVTGGLGGLGLRLAHWLAEHGARNVVLTGRSAPNDEAKIQLNELQKAGVRVEVRRCDIRRRDDVAALLASIAEELPPLRGVFHLAGLLDDGVIREQTRERFDRVFAAKAIGAWWLHELTRSLPLDHFVLFSSAAALLGSPGQGNYAAANSLLDGLAHDRRSQRLPALSVNWGSWSDVGMAARLKESQGSRWAEAGIGWIDPDKGMRTLEDLMLAGDVQAGVLPMNWPQFFARIPEGAEPRWLSDLATAARQASDKGVSGPPALLVMLQEVTPGERIETATNHLRRQAAQVLAMDEHSLPDTRRPLNELGFDSLTGVEFCNRVSRAIGHSLNPTLLFEYPTLESLAGYVVRDLLEMECDGTATPAAPAATPEAEQPEAAREEALDQVEGMTDDEMDALVLLQLQRLQSGSTTE